MSHTNKSSPKFMWSREKGKVGRRASFFDFVISRAKKSLFLFQDIQPHPYSTCKSHNHWSPAPWSSSEILKITGNLSLSSDFWFCFFFLTTTEEECSKGFLKTDHCLKVTSWTHALEFCGAAAAGTEGSWKGKFGNWAFSSSRLSHFSPSLA